VPAELEEREKANVLQAAFNDGMKFTDSVRVNG